MVPSTMALHVIKAVMCFSITFLGRDGLGEYDLKSTRTDCKRLPASATRFAPSDICLNSYSTCAVWVFTRQASRGRGALCGVGDAVLGCVYLVRGSWYSGLSHVSLAMEGVREETMDTKKLIGAMVA